jgi:hypothetical protein
VQLTLKPSRHKFIFLARAFYFNRTKWLFLLGSDMSYGTFSFVLVMVVLLVLDLNNVLVFFFLKSLDFLLAKQEKKYTIVNTSFYTCKYFRHC